METGRTNEQMMQDMFARRNNLLKEEYDLSKEIASFLCDYRIDFGDSVMFGSLVADTVFADHNSDSAIGMYDGMLILDTVCKDFKDLTEDDVEEAIASGRAVYVDELSLNDQTWILDRVYKRLQERKKRTYIVKREIVEDDRVVKTITSSYSNFADAVDEFHKLEQKYEEQGYELDDDTSEYDEEDADNDSFFNNALNDKQTVRIFLEVLK